MLLCLIPIASMSTSTPAISVQHPRSMLTAFNLNEQNSCLFTFNFVLKNLHIKIEPHRDDHRKNAIMRTINWTQRIRSILDSFLKEQKLFSSHVNQKKRTIEMTIHLTISILLYLFPCINSCFTNELQL